MYKNTVSLDELEERTLVRVRSELETMDETEKEARALAQQGIKTLIFPDKKMLTLWRLRLAALA